MRPPTASAAGRQLMGWLGDGLRTTTRSGRSMPCRRCRPGRRYRSSAAATMGRRSRPISACHCFAHFIRIAGPEQVTALYREGFRPHPGIPGRLAAPHAALGVFALTADTEAEASRRTSFRSCGACSAIPARSPPPSSVEEAEAYPYKTSGSRRPRKRSRRAGAGEGKAWKRWRPAQVAQAEEVAILSPSATMRKRGAQLSVLAEVLRAARGRGARLSRAGNRRCGLGAAVGRAAAAATSRAPARPPAAARRPGFQRETRRPSRAPSIRHGTLDHGPARRVPPPRPPGQWRCRAEPFRCFAVSVRGVP